MQQRPQVQILETHAGVVADHRPQMLVRCQTVQPGMRLPDIAARIAVPGAGHRSHRGQGGQGRADGRGLENFRQSRQRFLAAPDIAVAAPGQTLLEYGQRPLEVVQRRSLGGAKARGPAHARGHCHAIQRQPHGLGQVIPVRAVLRHVLQRIGVRHRLLVQAEKTGHEVTIRGLALQSKRQPVRLGLRHPEGSLAAPGRVEQRNRHVHGIAPPHLDAPGGEIAERPGNQHAEIGVARVPGLHGRSRDRPLALSLRVPDSQQQPHRLKTRLLAVDKKRMV
ncbi:hypothetical protein D3C72_1221230 [compost metagenome]